MTTNNALTQVLLNSFEQYKRQLLGRRIWLACSGGRDSLSLAHLCQQLFKAGKLPFLPQLLHVNHGMQQANEVWAEQVSNWAKQNQIPCRVLEIDLVKKTEQEARQARYEAIMGVMNHNDVLILGHHQDDQVETLLMRLLNGAGVNGLSGMKEWSTKQSMANDYRCQKSIVLWRPLLSVSREQITEYANYNQLTYIDDPTNIASPPIDHIVEDKTLNDRAWLRSVLLPHITQRYPKAREAMARTGQLMQDAHIILNEQSTADLSKVSIATNLWCAILDIAQLNDLSNARQSAVIHSWLAPTAAELPPSKRLVEDVLALAQRTDANHQTSLYWDSGVYQYQIRRYQNKLYRLFDSYSQWLQLAPQTQSLSFVDNSLDSSIDKSVKVTDRLALKSSNLEFEWYFSGLLRLKKAIQQQWVEEDKSLTLIFEPLPRDLKLALLGRVGRKSGKKLLQAIDQPSFMRQSVVLCSLKLPTQAQPLPLLLVTPDELVALQSDFSHYIKPLVTSNELTSQLQRRV